MNTDEDIFMGQGVEITLKNEEDFLKIKETLTRIGRASRKTNTLTQSCHILHKKGRYVIIHFKELMKLDGTVETVDEEDISRRNTITKLLEEWGLVIVNTPITGPVASMADIKVVSHKDRSKWTLKNCYTVGK